MNKFNGLVSELYKMLNKTISTMYLQIRASSLKDQIKIHLQTNPIIKHLTTNNLHSLISAY